MLVKRLRILKFLEIQAQSRAARKAGGPAQLWSWSQLQSCADCVACAGVPPLPRPAPAPHPPLLPPRLPTHLPRPYRPGPPHRARVRTSNSTGTSARASASTSASASASTKH